MTNKTYAVVRRRTIGKKKGVRVIADAWRTLSEKIPCHRREGPLLAEHRCRRHRERIHRIRWSGQSVPRDKQQCEWIAAAKVLSFSFICNETFGRSNDRYQSMRQRP